MKTGNEAQIRNRVALFAYRRAGRGSCLSAVCGAATGSAGVGQIAWLDAVRVHPGNPGQVNALFCMFCAACFAMGFWRGVFGNPKVEEVGR